MTGRRTARGRRISKASALFEDISLRTIALAGLLQKTADVDAMLAQLTRVGQTGRAERLDDHQAII